MRRSERQGFRHCLLWSSRCDEPIGSYSSSCVQCIAGQEYGGSVQCCVLKRVALTPIFACLGVGRAPRSRPMPLWSWPSRSGCCCETWSRTPPFASAACSRSSRRHLPSGPSDRSARAWRLGSYLCAGTHLTADNLAAWSAENDAEG